MFTLMDTSVNVAPPLDFDVLTVEVSCVNAFLKLSCIEIVLFFLPALHKWSAISYIYTD